MIPLTPRLFDALATVLGDGELTPGDEDTRLVQAVPGLAPVVARLLARDLKQVTLDLAAESRLLSQWLKEQGVSPGLGYILLKRWVGEDEAFANAYFAIKSALLMERDQSLSTLAEGTESVEIRTARLALEAGRLDPDKADRMLPHGPPKDAPMTVGRVTLIDKRKTVVINAPEFQKRYLDRMGMKRALVTYDDHADIV
jgi:hypothetical protein